MQLNLPIEQHLSQSKSILITGMGGGYDVFSGLPLYFELSRLGKTVHLANLSFADIVGVDDGEALTDTLVGITADIEDSLDYFPEYYLSQWFDTIGEDITIWCFHKIGARPLAQNYKVLVKHLDIDAIILVDGGVDSLMHGDEPHAGTILEDSLSLLAVNELSNIPVRIVACLGMGVEYEISYPHVFENIAHLTKQNAFWGSCALIKQMESYQQFEDAVLYVFDQQPQFPSVICSSIVSAVLGHYGDYHLISRTKDSELHISALMPMYWFFDLKTVARNNLLLPHLRLTFDIDEAWNAMTQARSNIEFRVTPQHPLR